MAQTAQQKAAANFAKQWSGKGDEKQETSRFWIQLLQNVLGVSDPANYIEFEKKVQLSHTSFIDAYIPETRVLIEQKGVGVDLQKKSKQSDDSMLTPFEQAKRYVDEMKDSEKPRWVVVCNFQEFDIYDFEKEGQERYIPEVVLLKDLGKEYYRLQFLVNEKDDHIQKEEEISLAAGELVKKLYNSLIKEYINPNEKSLCSLNILCVRIVFCLYAEDAGLFGTRTAFEDYIKSFPLEALRKGLIDLFKALNTKDEERDKYDLQFSPFPYVNGGLFADEDVEIPNFTQEIVDVIVNLCAPFNWRDISPTIFGALFESTLNPQTRRSGGMHYTSIENIHKVIDPLFLDALKEELATIMSMKSDKEKKQSLHDFQKKLGTLTFLDPACGCGNFLTETYLCLRRLENKIISILNNGEKLLGFDSFIYVKISQFYGIEINDFAVAVAKTALWIAESQMIAETEAILSQNIDFLPLKTKAFIVEGNALRMNWETLKSTDDSLMPTFGLFAGFSNETDGVRKHYDYIIGNPPFVGYSYKSDSQKEDILLVYTDENGKPYKQAGKIDYVAGWYFKAAQLMKGTQTRAALVSTNSITQGEQVAAIWRPLIERFDLQMDFAWRTFRWESESNQKAQVHCVIVGFSCNKDIEPVEMADGGFDKLNHHTSPRRIFNADGTVINAKKINGYLNDFDNVFIDSQQKPICNVPQMASGGKPVEGGFLIFTDEEKNDFLKKEPKAEPYFKQFLGSDEFINGYRRWCLWLIDASPKDIRTMPHVMERVEAVRNSRLKSKKKATQMAADRPTQFMEIKNYPDKMLIIPEVSSEHRKYVPIDFSMEQVICSNKVRYMPNATLYHFGVLTSSVHNAWMRIVCGRLGNGYSYSINIVYNNFPWPLATETNQSKIEKTAQKILDVRALYPDSTLADLYDELTMPIELRKAHEANDAAVLAAYGWPKDLPEDEIVTRLFKMYEELTVNQPETKTKGRKKTK